jgi:hypothetical protein
LWESRSCAQLLPQIGPCPKHSPLPQLPYLRYKWRVKP